MEIQDGALSLPTAPGVGIKDVRLDVFARGGCVMAVIGFVRTRNDEQLESSRGGPISASTLKRRFP
jgi:hypothetical protein